MARTKRSRSGSALKTKKIGLTNASVNVIKPNVSLKSSQPQKTKKRQNIQPPPPLKTRQVIPSQQLDVKLNEFIPKTDTKDTKPTDVFMFQQQNDNTGPLRNIQPPSIESSVLQREYEKVVKQNAYLQLQLSQSEKRREDLENQIEDYKQVFLMVNSGGNNEENKSSSPILNPAAKTPSNNSYKSSIDIEFHNDLIKKNKKLTAQVENQTLQIQKLGKRVKELLSARAYWKLERKIFPENDPSNRPQFSQSYQKSIESISSPFSSVNPIQEKSKKNLKTISIEKLR